MSNADELRAKGYNLRSLSTNTPLPMPSPADVERFKQIYLKTCGEELDNQSALTLAIKTLHFAYFAMTPCPVPADLDVIPEEEVLSEVEGAKAEHAQGENSDAQ